mmetsp:Transcript_15293/g.25823  ORF Transcript_15293/g.25823 Transcript_15293/m.25823 type:complete len:202 (-) Transcript_15293:49-654(-)
MIRRAVFPMTNLADPIDKHTVDLFMFSHVESPFDPPLSKVNIPVIVRNDPVSPLYQLICVSVAKGPIFLPCFIGCIVTIMTHRIQIKQYLNLGIDLLDPLSRFQRTSFDRSIYSVAISLLKHHHILCGELFNLFLRILKCMSDCHPRTHVFPIEFWEVASVSIEWIGFAFLKDFEFASVCFNRSGRDAVVFVNVGHCLVGG